MEANFADIVKIATTFVKIVSLLYITGELQIFKRSVRKILAG